MDGGDARALTGDGAVGPGTGGRGRRYARRVDADRVQSKLARWAWLLPPAVVAGLYAKTLRFPLVWDDVVLFTPGLRPL